MKNLAIIALLSLAAGSAFASKARVSALSSAAHLTDVQGIFTNPTDITEFGDWATFEMGGREYAAALAGGGQTAANGQQEAGFARSNGNTRYGFYMNHKEPAVLLSRGVSGIGIGQENPFEFFFGMKGDLKWAVSLGYSNADRKSATLKENVMFLRGGIRGAVWDAYIHLGLADTAENATTKLTGKTTIQTGGSWTIDNLYLFAELASGGFKTEAGSTTTADDSVSRMKIGVVNNMKKDSTDFFYGIHYHSYSFKDAQSTVSGANDVSYTMLPVIVGVEHEANSWLVLRASFTQNLAIMGTYKAGNGDADTIAESGTVAAGAGLKFNKFTLDGSLQAARSTTGAFGSDTNFLSNASLTYMF